MVTCCTLCPFYKSKCILAVTPWKLNFPLHSPLSGFFCIPASHNSRSQSNEGKHSDIVAHTDNEHQPQLHWKIHNILQTDTLPCSNVCEVLEFMMSYVCVQKDGGFVCRDANVLMIALCIDTEKDNSCWNKRVAPNLRSRLQTTFLFCSSLSTHDTTSTNCMKLHYQALQLELYVDCAES